MSIKLLHKNTNVKKSKWLFLLVVGKTKMQTNMQYDVKQQPHINLKSLSRKSQDLEMTHKTVIFDNGPDACIVPRYRIYALEFFVSEIICCMT